MRKEEEKDLQNESEIEDLLKSVTQESVVEKTEDSKEEKKAKLKRNIIWASAVTGVIIVGLALTPFFMPENEQFVDKTKAPTWTQKEEERATVNLLEKRWEYETPVELKSWSKTPYFDDEFWSNEEYVNEALKEGKSLKGIFTVFSSVSPGEQGQAYDDPNGELSSGKTNDLSQIYTSTGEVNQNFKFAVREDYIKSLVINTERLINPLFGGWGDVQNPGLIPDVKAANGFESLKSAFSKQWWDSNVNLGANASNLPILADWNNDKFGGLNLRENTSGVFGSFYGQIDKDKFIEGQVNSYDEKGMPIIQVKVPVTFYAFSNTEEKIMKNGALTLTLKPNYSTVDVKNRVIIDSATLTML